MSNQQLYPEKRPADVGPIDKFVFTTEGIADAKRDTSQMADALAERIRKINERFTLDGKNVISAILSLSHDKEELKGLAKGLDRVADLIENLDDLDAKNRVLDLAEKDPSWFTWAFGDFSDQFEKALANLEESLDLQEDESASATDTKDL